MEDLLPTLLAHGSAVMLFGLLVVSGLGVPIPEDIVLLAGGALAHRGVIALPVIAVATLWVTIGRRRLVPEAKAPDPASAPTTEGEEGHPG